MIKTLDQMGCEQGTDRASSGLHDYLRKGYEPILAPFRHEPIVLLEMGVLGGAGIRMWNEYFDNPLARIVGIDIQDYGGVIPKNSRVSVKYGSQSDPVFLATLPPTFDIIIDDAGHFAHDQILSYGMLWSRVRAGGWYIIEDLHTAHSSQHCNGSLTITQFIGGIITNMQDHNGPAGMAKLTPDDQIEQIVIRKGIAFIEKRLIQ